jgi:DNA-binding NtrC family response regulator
MASARADSSGPVYRGKVLIVEDQEGMRELLRLILESQYCVAEADSGAALRQALDHDQPDVVLLDMKLPDANGLGLLPAIKQRWPGTEVIVLTGAADGSEAMTCAAQAVNCGAFSMLSKSAEFDLQTVLAGVSSAMAHRLQGPANSFLPPQP